MKKAYVLNVIVLLFLFFPTLLNSQTKGWFKGNIVDLKNSTPLEYATVSIFSQKDSTLITGDVSDVQGQFKIPIPYGNYFAKIEFLGYLSQELTPFSITKKSKTYDLGILKMSGNTAILGEVEVLSAKGDVQMMLDKKVFNVGKDVTSTGGTALDILDNVPSVTVEQDGKVLLRGNSGVQILVDGKPSSLVAGEGLKRLPSNLIAQIEVITNPSAKYEAAGVAGILNIILKKEKKGGVNGTVSATVGYPDIGGGSLGLNWRKEKFNLFTNIGLDYRKNNGGGGLYQEYKKDTLFISNQDREHELGGWGGNIQLGADFFINDNNTITTSLNLQKGEDTNETFMEFREYIFTTDNLTDIITRLDNTTKTNDNLEYALTYNKKWEKKGHELVADIRFQDNVGDDASVLEQRTFNPDFSPNNNGNLNQRTNGTEGEKRWITKLDYTLPLQEKGKLELGYQGSIREIINDFLVEEFDDVSWVEIPEVSNDFKYDEKIFGVYATYQNKVKNFSYKIGGRVEHTDVVTELLETNQTNPRNYTNFFPSVQLSYDLKKDNKVKLSYSRRVRRPVFNQLNPFFTFADPRNLFEGNPDLNPEFADSYELEHIKYFGKGSISTALFYRHRTDVIYRVLEFVGGDTTLLKNQNLLSQDDLGVDVSMSYQLFSWWKLNASGSVFYVDVDGTNIDPSFSNNNYTGQGRVSSRFTLKKKTDLQIRYNYRSNKVNAQGTSLAYSYVDIGVSHPVFKNRGKLTLNISDVFNSNVWKGRKDIPTLYRETEFRWRFRTVRLNFSYRFGKK